VDLGRSHSLATEEPTMKATIAALALVAIARTAHAEDPPPTIVVVPAPAADGSSSGQVVQATSTTSTTVAPSATPTTVTTTSTVSVTVRTPSPVPREPVFIEDGNVYARSVVPVETPYDGGAIPVGAQVRSRSSHGLVAFGATFLSVPYLFSFIGGLICSYDCHDQTPLFVPVAGPFLAATSSRIGSESRNWLLVDGFVQAVGAAAFVAGIASRHRVLVFSPSSTARGSWRPTEWAVLPTITPSGGGVSIGARF
jgi:hypothetical protein